MKSDLTIPAKKRKYPMHLFVDAITYRVPLPITKVIALTNTTYSVCPRCDQSLEREYMSFCDRCGQKLNWDLFEHAKIIYPDYQKNNFL